MRLGHMFWWFVFYKSTYTTHLVCRCHLGLGRDGRFEILIWFLSIVEFPRSNIRFSFGISSTSFYSRWLKCISSSWCSGDFFTTQTSFCWLRKMGLLDSALLMNSQQRHHQSNGSFLSTRGQSGNGNGYLRIRIRKSGAVQFMDQYLIWGPDQSTPCPRTPTRNPTLTCKSRCKMGQAGPCHMPCWADDVARLARFGTARDGPTCPQPIRTSSILI